jgi:hypothetical protein
MAASTSSLNSINPLSEGDLFQCKRYSENNLVGAPEVRDFYGAVIDLGPDTLAEAPGPTFVQIVFPSGRIGGVTSEVIAAEAGVILFAAVDGSTGRHCAGCTCRGHRYIRSPRIVVVILSLKFRTRGPVLFLLLLILHTPINKERGLEHNESHDQANPQGKTVGVARYEANDGQHREGCVPRRKAGPSPQVAGDHKCLDS